MAADPAGEPAADATVDALRLRVAQLEDQLLRALADLDNVRKRSAQQVDRVRTEERAEVAGRWLPVLDNLDRALTHAAADPDAIIAGVEAIRAQALDILRGLGYPRRDDLGVPFDPNRHEAVGGVPAGTGTPPGTVVDVVRPGYGGQDHQLRPAAVVVARERDGDQP